jgi:hypothetical protein
MKRDTQHNCTQYSVIMLNVVAPRSLLQYNSTFKKLHLSYWIKLLFATFSINETKHNIILTLCWMSLCRVSLCWMSCYRRGLISIKLFFQPRRDGDRSSEERRTFWWSLCCGEILPERWTLKKESSCRIWVFFSFRSKKRRVSWLPQARRESNGTERLKKCKLFEYRHLLLLRDIWWSKF